MVTVAERPFETLEAADVRRIYGLVGDPKLDDLALMEALKTPAFYVGALGSRRNNASRRERLKEFDLSETELAKLHGPAGIYVGSRTPPEIAVSILAEVTAVKNGVMLPSLLRIEGAKKERETVQSEPSANAAFYAHRIGRRVQGQ